MADCTRLRTVSSRVRPMLPALLPLLPSLAAAQVEDVDRLDPVVVTATRTAETADETLAAVSVIERAEIERRQSRTMSDVLRGLPGVTIGSNGGLGHNTDLFLRGTNADNVLLLVDGVKLGSVTSGFIPWAAIPVGQVERVEVVRGPRSSLYGSEAIGGVVQVFTRKGRGGPLRARFVAGAGTYETFNGQFGLSGGTETDFGAGWFDLGLGYERTDGFNVCDGEPGVGGCRVFEFDRDGYRNGNGALNAGWRFSERFEFDLNFLRSEGDLEFDGSAFFGNEKTTVLQVLGARAVLQPLDAWTATLRAGRSWDDTDVFFDGDFINRIDTRRDQLSLQNDIALAPEQLLTLGVDYQRDTLDTTAEFAATSRDDTGVFGELLSGIGRHRLQLALRYDDNSQFGGETTGSLAWGYQLGDGVRLSASYGTAFKAPSFNALYFPGAGNPELDPERSGSVEVGVSGDHPLGAWAVNAYQTRIDDLIEFDANFQAGNIAEARIRGVELWTTADLAGWLLDASLTLLDPRNESDGADHGNLLRRRPQQTVRFDADRRFGRIGVGGTLFASGRRWADDANRRRLDGFTLVDLRAEYAFNDALRVQGRLENLFDQDYETVEFFNQPGRSFFVTLRYEP